MKLSLSKRRADSNVYVMKCQRGIRNRKQLIFYLHEEMSPRYHEPETFEIKYATIDNMLRVNGRNYIVSIIISIIVLIVVSAHMSTVAPRLSAPNLMGGLQARPGDVAGSSARAGQAVPRGCSQRQCLANAAARHGPRGGLLAGLVRAPI